MSPISRNSVLEELTVRGEEDLNVICVKAVLQGKGEDESILRGIVYITKSRGFRV